MSKYEFCYIQYKQAIFTQHLKLCAQTSFNVTNNKSKKYYLICTIKWVENLTTCAQNTFTLKKTIKNGCNVWFLYAPVWVKVVSIQATLLTQISLYIKTMMMHTIPGCTSCDCRTNKTFSGILVPQWYLNGFFLLANPHFSNRIASSLPKNNMTQLETNLAQGSLYQLVYLSQGSWYLNGP